MVINLIASRTGIYYRVSGQPVLSFWRDLGSYPLQKLLCISAIQLKKVVNGEMSVKFTSLIAGKDCVGDWDKIIFLLTSAWFGNELLVPRFCQGLKNRAAELTCKQPLLLVPRCAWSRRTWVISLSFVLLIPPAQLLWMIHLKSRSGGQEDVGTGTEEQWAGLGK